MRVLDSHPKAIPWKQECYIGYSRGLRHSVRMNHVEGPLHVLLVEKEGQPYLICYISSFSFF